MHTKTICRSIGFKTKGIKLRSASSETPFLALQPLDPLMAMENLIRNRSPEGIVILLVKIVAKLVCQSNSTSFYLVYHNDIVVMVPLLLLLTLLCCPVYAFNLVFSTRNFIFESDNCLTGQPLLVYDDNVNEAQPICNLITQSQLNQICSQVGECSASTGVITSSTDPTDIPLILEGDGITFNTNFDCSVDVLCYNPAENCVLPDIQDGSFLNETGAAYTNGVLAEGERVKLSCSEGQTWYWTDFLSCIKMSSGVAQLSTTPVCVPLPDNYKMQLLVNASSSGEAADMFLLVDGTYSVICFETAIASLFLMGLQNNEDIDIFPGYDTRPKREITTQLLNVRLDGLDIFYNRRDQSQVGILEVGFYLFYSTEVLSPAVVTKVLSLVPREQYDMVLESYCRLSQCENSDPNSEDCKAIPSMQFNSFPRPDTPCNFQGKELQYGDAVPLICSDNEYIAEKEETVCLFSDTYSPSELPKCEVCGKDVQSETMQFGSPSKADGTNARNSSCTWEVEVPHNNIGQFWQIRRDDKWGDCTDPVDYIAVFQYDENGTVNSTTTDICFGTYMRLGPKFTVQFTSNPNSDSARSFNFFFQADLPPLPWYRKYMAIIIAGPVIVLFFTGLVILGVYCDNRNKKSNEIKEVKVDLENGDQISNGTWKPSAYKEGPQEQESTISPQPRVHNAVTGPEKRKKKRKKKRVAGNKTTDSGISQSSRTSVGSNGPDW